MINHLLYNVNNIELTICSKDRDVSKLIVKIRTSQMLHYGIEN